MRNQENVAVVCGAGGYVGRHLVEFLLKKGFGVRAVMRSYPSKAFDEMWFSPLYRDNYRDLCVGDLSDPNICKVVVSGAKWVYNLAANVGGIGFIGKHAADCMSTATININLLKAVREQPVAGYFFASSSCVYPESKSPLTEDISCPTVFGYGDEKAFSEKVCQAFHSDYGVPVRIARYHTIYGPGDNRAGKEHVTEALAKKIIRAKLRREPEITIWGNGHQTRSFLYIADCVEGTFRIMHSNHSGPLNLAHRTPASILQLVEMLEEIAGQKVQRFFKLDATVGCQDKTANMERCQRVLGWEPQTPLMEGLRRMYNSYYDAALQNEP